MKTYISILTCICLFITFVAHADKEHAQDKTKGKKQIPPGLIKTDYPDIYFTQDQFNNFICSKINAEFLRKRVQKNVIPELFAVTNKLHLYEMFDMIIDKVTREPHDPHEDTYVLVLNQMKYRSLIPHISLRLLNDDFTSNTLMGSYLQSHLRHLPHVDTLKMCLYLNDTIPKRSPLRRNNDKEWHISMPLFINPECMNFYINIVNSPDKYTFIRWYDAVEKIAHFTNDTAVAALEYAGKILQRPHVYWPEERRSYIRSKGIEDRLENQQAMKKGKKALSKPSPELLDETE